MGLRLFERTLASVKPDLRPLYVADAEHGFRLDLIDLDEFVHGLRSALRKQRDANKELRAKYSVTDDGAEALAPFGETKGATIRNARRARRTVTTTRDAEPWDGVSRRVGCTRWLPHRTPTHSGKGKHHEQAANQEAAEQTEAQQAAKTA